MKKNAEKEKFQIIINKEINELQETIEKMKPKERADFLLKLMDYERSLLPLDPFK